MYRARVQAVNGTKINAGGKWLQCIGNKIFHVGEYVWTDGRCVYGNNYENQQPLVISSPKDEIIPIVTYYDYFVFYKNKLIKCADRYSANYNQIFINTKSGKSYFVNNYLFSASNTLWHDGEIEDEIHGILAANIDNAGNSFSISLDNFLISINKNEEVIQTIDLGAIADNVLSQIEQPSPIFFYEELPGYPEKVFEAGYIEFNVNYSFIENENLWALYIVFSYRKATTVAVVPYMYPFTENVNQGSVNCYLRNDKIVLGEASTDFQAPLPTGIEIKSVDEPDPNQKLPLQDNYYFTEEAITETVGYREIYGEDGPETVPVFRFYIKRTVFSPNDQIIFSGLFDKESIIIFRRVKSGYLMIVYHRESQYTVYKEVETRMNMPYFKNGIFLFTSNTWHFLSSDIDITRRFHNRRLQPMPKNTTWQKHIREITLI